MPVESPNNQPQPEIQDKFRLWLEGIVVYEPTPPNQGRPFAYWEKSNLRTREGIVGVPPPDYEGVTEVYLDS